MSRVDTDVGMFSNDKCFEPLSETPVRKDQDRCRKQKEIQSSRSSSTVFDMDFPVSKMSQYCFVLPPAVLLFAVFHYFRLSKKRSLIASTSSIQATTSQDVKNLRPNSTASRPIQWYQNMFFQLQHLENYLAVLELAREELLAMFSRGISLTLKQPVGSILPIEHYDAKGIWTFLEDEYDKLLAKCGSYLERRKQGQGPELFATAEAAKVWPIQQAPVKFVDGAWLAHIHKITYPFALRSVTKAACQVMSEELGDGDLSKHHVYLHRQLLEDIGCPFQMPTAPTSPNCASGMG